MIITIRYPNYEFIFYYLNYIQSKKKSKKKNIYIINIVGTELWSTNFGSWYYTKI